MRKLAIMGAALALAAGTACAENETSFRAMDKNNDGYLSKAEAAGNPDLARRFDEADVNKDGKLSPMEYLKVMAKIDAHNAAEKVSNKTDDKAASGGTNQK
jgi:Ca2+-binding EF-hand superfamily protein